MFIVVYSTAMKREIKQNNLFLIHKNSLTLQGSLIRYFYIIKFMN